MDWKFQDPPNLAVIVHRTVLYSGEWIAYVSHDADDGGWQFHSREVLTAEEAAVVSLQNILELDAGIADLADLPMGWHAWREEPASTWQRSPTV